MKLKKEKNNLLLASLTLLALVSGNLGTLAAEDDLESQEIPAIQASPYSTEEVIENNATETTANSSNSQVLTGEVVSVNAGAYTPGSVDRSFTSATSRVGDRGYITLSQSLNGIPAGSRVEFVVSSVSRAKRRFDKPGQMQLKAVKIIYPDGQTVNLSGDAYIVRDAGETVLVGETKKKRVAKAAGKTAAGAGVGALGGLIGSALGGNASGKATAIGAGIGAGVGLLGAGLSKGKEVTINSGDKLLLKFNKAMQLTPTAGN